MSDLDFKVKNGLVVNNNLLVATNGKISVNTTNPLTTFHINTADALIVPVGGSGSRPSANDGMIRYNTDIKAFEGSMEGNWSIIMQSNTNSSIFSTILVSEVDFDSTANTKIKAGANSIVLYTSNSAALTVSNNALQSYSLTANSTAVTVNNALISNVSTLYIGNSTVNAVINSTSAKFSNSTSSFTLNIPTSTQVSNGSYFLNANGSYGLVMFSPSGSNTQIQFNDSGSWGASAGLVFNKTSNNLTVGNTVTATTFVGNLNGTSNNATYLGGVAASGYQTTAGLSANVATLTSNNATYLNGVAASYYANTTFTYYIGTSALSINRVSAPQTLTGISIDGTANNITSYTINQNLGSNNTPTFKGLNITGDIYAYRTANPNTGTVFLNQGGTRYLFNNESYYHLVNAELIVNGTQVLRSGQTASVSSLTVTGDIYTSSSLTVTGDIYAYRTADPNTGCVFLTQNGSRYLFYNGVNYHLVNTELIVNGTQVLRSGQTASISSLTITGSLTANGTTGSAGQVLHSNGTIAYWAADDTGVTSVTTGNGLSGGPITTTGTISVLANSGLTANSTGLFVIPGNGVVTTNSTGIHVGAGNGITVNSISVGVLANTGIVANSTGLFVNSSYIATLTSNNATYLNGVAASGYQTTAGLSANVATLTSNNATYLNGQLSTYYANTTSPVFTSVNTSTLNVGANVVANTTAFKVGANVLITTTGLSVGNSTVNTSLTSTTFSGTSNNATYLDGVAASGYQTTAGLSANVATLTSNNATYLGGVAASGYQTTAGLSANVATLTSNNATYLGGVAASYYANTTSPIFTSVNTSTLNVGANVVANTTAFKVGANVLITTTGLSVGNSTVNTSLTSTTFSGTSNNATYLNGVAASGYQTTAGLSANVATLTSNNATYLNGVAASGYQTTAGLSANVATLTSNNTTYLGGRSVGTSANNIIALDGNSKLPAVDGSQLTNITSVKSNIRQTVSSGPTSTGSPSILAATYASLVVTTQNVSNSAPLIVSAANGYSATGDNDYIGSSTSNLSWTVASSNTSYLPVSVTSAGVVAAANPVTLKPVYQQYGTPSTTSGQYTFNIQEMKMYLGNGSVANQVNHVIIGHVVSGASTVTSTVVYAYNGYYESGWVATFPAAGTSVSKNSNLGVGLGKGRLLALVTSAIGNYSVNDIIENFYVGAAGPVYGPVSVVTTDTTVGFVTGAANIGTWNKTTGATVPLAGSASVSYQLIHERSW